MSVKSCAGAPEILGTSVTLPDKGVMVMVSTCKPAYCDADRNLGKGLGARATLAVSDPCARHAGINGA